MGDCNWSMTALQKNSAFYSLAVERTALNQSRGADAKLGDANRHRVDSAGRVPRMREGRRQLF